MRSKHRGGGATPLWLAGSMPAAPPPSILTRDCASPSPSSSSQQPPARNRTPENSRSFLRELVTVLCRSETKFETARQPPAPPRRRQGDVKATAGFANEQFQMKRTATAP